MFALDFDAFKTVPRYWPVEASQLDEAVLLLFWSCHFVLLSRSVCVSLIFYVSLPFTFYLPFLLSLSFLGFSCFSLSVSLYFSLPPSTWLFLSSLCISLSLPLLGFSCFLFVFLSPFLYLAFLVFSLYFNLSLSLSVCLSPPLCFVLSSYLLCLVSLNSSQIYFDSKKLKLNWSSVSSSSSSIASQVSFLKIWSFVTKLVFLQTETGREELDTIDLIFKLDRFANK
jgi:hypothetical protein